MPLRPALATDPEAGMTLVEIIVALAIIAVMTSTAALSMGTADRGAGPETEATRLAARIALAADVALIEGTTVNLVWDEHGYVFVGTHQDGQSASPSTPKPRHDLGPDVRLAGPTLAGTLQIHEAAGTGLASFVLQGRDAAWQVDFNGLTASAKRIPAA